MTFYTYFISVSHITLVVCVCVWHTCFTVYNYYEPVNGIDPMDLIDFYNFKDPIL